MILSPKIAWKYFFFFSSYEEKREKGTYCEDMQKFSAEPKYIWYIQARLGSTVVTNLQI